MAAKLVGIQVGLVDEPSGKYLVVPHVVLEDNGRRRFVDITSQEALGADNISGEHCVDRGAYPDRAEYSKGYAEVYTDTQGTPQVGAKVTILGIVDIPDRRTEYIIRVGNTIGKAYSEMLLYLAKWLVGSNFMVTVEGNGSLGFSIL